MSMKAAARVCARLPHLEHADAGREEYGQVEVQHLLVLRRESHQHKIEERQILSSGNRG
jgi:hypothetical protein